MRRLIAVLVALGLMAAGATVVSAPANATVPRGGSVYVHGGMGSPYRARLWAHDHVNCPGHVYGAPMVRYVRLHPCSGYGAGWGRPEGESRVLLTTNVHGRTAVISYVLVAMYGRTALASYNAADGLQRLQESNCGCGVTDLVTAGARVPGQRWRHWPRGEVSVVGGQDMGVWVVDAAWLHGRTNPHDRTLNRLANSTVLSNASGW